MLIIGAGAVARAAEALATARGADVVLVTRRPAVVEQLAAAGVKARTLPAPDQLAAQVTQQLDGALPEVVFDTTGAWLPAAVRCVAPFGRVVVMIERRPYAELGGGHYGWLETRHHFSFAHYYAPERMGWGSLRVWNDDIIAPHSAFERHPHRDMEIITYVRSGAITHEDSLVNRGRTVAGDVQVMSAGTVCAPTAVMGSPSMPSMSCW
ncbi:MAG: pirin family protein [Spongiibacteraceae bacterium]|jgi:hypothetical protein|nr:pirin family protein [Spongiibacteraceae bacterium]